MSADERPKDCSPDPRFSAAPPDLRRPTSKKRILCRCRFGGEKCEKWRCQESYGSYQLKVSMNRSSNTQASSIFCSWGSSMQLPPDRKTNVWNWGRPIPPTTGRSAALDASRRVMPTHCWCRIGIDLTWGSRVSHAPNQGVQGSVQDRFGRPTQSLDGFSTCSPWLQRWPQKNCGPIFMGHQGTWCPWCPVTTNRPYREAHNFCTWRLFDQWTKLLHGDSTRKVHQLRWVTADDAVAAGGAGRMTMRTMMTIKMWKAPRKVELMV